MADSGVDIAQLTADQQLALQQFTAVTNQELEAAVPLLQRCQWNVQVSARPFESFSIALMVFIDCDSKIFRWRTRRPRHRSKL